MGVVGMDSHNFVTFFYNKRIGTIKQYSTGTTDMSFYGDERADYELIHDFIVVPLDKDARDVMRNPRRYSVNTVTKEIEVLAESVTKFKVKKEKGVK